MNEYLSQIIASLKVLWISVFGLLYGLGGINHKWIRRYCGALWMGLGVFIFAEWQNTFHWYYLIYPILLCASLHIGYGGTDNVWIKICKRTIYGMALAISALPLCFSSHLWFLFGMHCVLCIMGSIFLGVFNISSNARSEENLVAVLSTLIPLYLI